MKEVERNSTALNYRLLDLAQADEIMYSMLIWLVNNSESTSWNRLLHANKIFWVDFLKGNELELNFSEFRKPTKQESELITTMQYIGRKENTRQRLQFVTTYPLSDGSTLLSDDIEITDELDRKIIDELLSIGNEDISLIKLRFRINRSLNIAIEDIEEESTEKKELISTKEKGGLIEKNKEEYIKESKKGILIKKEEILPLYEKVMYGVIPVFSRANSCDGPFYTMKNDNGSISFVSDSAEEFNNDLVKELWNIAPEVPSLARLATRRKRAKPSRPQKSKNELNNFNYFEKILKDFKKETNVKFSSRVFMKVILAAKKIALEYEKSYNDDLVVNNIRAHYPEIVFNIMGKVFSRSSKNLNELLNTPAGKTLNGEVLEELLGTYLTVKMLYKNPDMQPLKVDEFIGKLGKNFPIIFSNQSKPYTSTAVVRP